MKTLDRWVIVAASVLSMVFLMILSGVEGMAHKHMLVGAIAPIGAAVIYAAGRLIQTVED